MEEKVAHNSPLLRRVTDPFSNRPVVDNFQEAPAASRRSATGFHPQIWRKRHKNKPTKSCAEHPGLLQPAVAFGQCSPAASPAGLARKKPDETLACPARSRLHGGKRQQAAAVQGLRREFRPNARLFLAESLMSGTGTEIRCGCVPVSCANSASRLS